MMVNDNNKGNPDKFSELKITIKNLYGMSDSYIRKLLKKYTRFLDILSENDKYLPAIDVKLIWMAHMDDNEDYNTYCINSYGKKLPLLLDELIDENDTLDKFHAYMQYNDNKINKVK